MSNSIYEKRPNGPNFLLIVILSGIAILVILAVALFLVKHEGKKMEQHGANPEPNSRLQWPLPASTPFPAA
jgi:heme/copper-type cytochrome/quinol oxidase subunit 2